MPDFMKILIAPDSFKGSLTAWEAGKAIEKGIKSASASFETEIIPMADGGEGTVRSLVDATGGSVISLRVRDPLMRLTESFYGILGDGLTAVIEMAAASGITLLETSERNPLKTTTFGTGELILDAIGKGCRRFILGLGGSATNDGGTGMASALGFRLLDSEGNILGHGGAELGRLASIDASGADRRLSECTFVAACDVGNPLTGSNGASAIFGPQKGATAEQVVILDKSLANFAEIIHNYSGKEIGNIPGAGAAGGMGAGVVYFLGASLERGFDIVAEITQLESRMPGSDLVITGEGMLDFQTRMGKTPWGVAQMATKHNIPVIAIAGSLGKDYKVLLENGFTSVFCICEKPESLEYSLRNASRLLENTSENIFRTIESLKPRS